MKHPGGPENESDEKYFFALIYTPLRENEEQIDIYITNTSFSLSSVPVSSLVRLVMSEAVLVSCSCHVRPVFRQVICVEFANIEQLNDRGLTCTNCTNFPCAGLGPGQFA